MSWLLYLHLSKSAFLLSLTIQISKGLVKCQIYIKISQNLIYYVRNTYIFTIFLGREVL